MNNSFENNLIGSASMLDSLLDDYRKCPKNEKNDKLKQIANILKNCIKNTDFEEYAINIINERHIQLDESLREVIDSRDENIIESALDEQDNDKLCAKIAIISNNISHYIQNNLFNKNRMNIFGEKLSDVYSNKLCSVLQKKYDIKTEEIENELDSFPTEYYNKKIASIELKKLLELYKSSEMKRIEDSPNISTLKEFNKSLILQKTMDNFFLLKERMIEKCINSRKVNCIVKEEPHVSNSNSKKIRVYIGCDNYYLCTECHADVKIVENCKKNFDKSVKKVKYLPENLGTYFPIELSDDEWKKYNKSKKPKREGYLSEYINVSRNFEEYDKKTSEYLSKEGEKNANKR